MNKNLCNSCRRANVDCPIWEPGKYIPDCIEYREGPENHSSYSGNLEKEMLGTDNLLHHDAEGFDTFIRLMVWLFGLSFLFLILSKLF